MNTGGSNDKHRKNVRFEGSKFPSSTPIFRSNINNNNELKESLLSNEYEMTHTNSIDNNRNIVNDVGIGSRTGLLTPLSQFQDNPSKIGLTSIKINKSDESNLIMHNNIIKYDDDDDDEKEEEEEDDERYNDEVGDNASKNKSIVKNKKKVKRMIREGYEWDVCLVLPNIDHIDYKDVPNRNGYISMYTSIVMIDDELMIIMK